MTQANGVAQMLGAIDAFAAFVMLWAMIRITTAAGMRTTTARWAFARRFVYVVTAIALFGLGVGRFNGDYPVEASEALFQGMLLFGIMAFPLLRAFNWITQDQFKAVDGTYERPTGRGRS